MATPTDQQQIRATLRRAMRNMGAAEAAHMAVVEAADILGMGEVSGAAMAWLDLPERVPPLMGAADAAEALGKKATNLKRMSPPLRVVQVISGRIPVYLASDVWARKAQIEPDPQMVEAGQRASANRRCPSCERSAALSAPVKREDGATQRTCRYCAHVVVVEGAAKERRDARRAAA